MKKSLCKMDIGGTGLNIIKAVYFKATAHIIFNCGKLKSCPLRSGTR